MNRQTNAEQHLKQLSEAVNLIEDALNKPLRVSDVCQVSPLSHWQFQRVFRAFVGDSIGNYIRGRRLSKAADQLRSSRSKQRILDLALEYQFGSQEAFTRSFTSVFNLSPVEVRDNQTNRLLEYKPRLDRDKILQFHSGIKKEPQIETFGPKKFVGLPLTILSPLGVEAETNSIVSNHWAKFDQRRQEISNRVSGRSYGFALAESEDFSDESLTYLAAAEVPELLEPPQGLRNFELPETLYASFEVTGFYECCNVTTDYIYGFWLPQSDFERASGPDFELFDHKIYKRGSESSVSSYFIPVKPKNRTNHQALPTRP